MRKKKELLARIGERLDIPREALPGGFGLTLSGQNELTVRGCRRILHYGEDCIRLSLGKTVLRMVALSEPFYGVTIITEGMMQGVGNTKTPFFFNVLGMWGMRIFGTFLCLWLLPNPTLVAAWACMIAHNLALFCMFSVYYKKGKWSPLHRGVQ